MPKSEKDISRKIQCNICYKYRCKNHQQYTSKLKPEIHKKTLNIWLSGIYFRNSQKMYSTYAHQSIWHMILIE